MLRSVTLKNCGITDGTIGDYASISPMPNVIQLVVAEKSFAKISKNFLTAISQYIYFEELTKFSLFPNLETLSVSCSSFEGMPVQPLAVCNKLKEISMTGTLLQEDEVVTVIANCQDLRFVVIH